MYTDDYCDAIDFAAEERERDERIAAEEREEYAQRKAFLAMSEDEQEALIQLECDEMRGRDVETAPAIFDEILNGFTRGYAAGIARRAA